LYKNAIYTEVTHSSKLCHHTKHDGLSLNDDSVSSTSEFRTTTILVLSMVRK